MRLALALTLLLAPCSNSKDAPPTPPTPTAAPAAAPAASKDPAKAKQLIASGAAVIDVRTADEFAAEHLDRAVNIPVQELPTRLAEIDKLVGGDKAKPIVLYCGSGHRAGTAKQRLDAAGYTQVVNGGGLGDLR
jgi:phage shock protein E